MSAPASLAAPAPARSSPSTSVVSVLVIVCTRDRRAAAHRHRADVDLAAGAALDVAPGPHAHVILGECGCFDIAQAFTPSGGFSRPVAAWRRPAQGPGPASPRQRPVGAPGRSRRGAPGARLASGAGEPADRGLGGGQHAGERPPTKTWKAFGSLTSRVRPLVCGARNACRRELPGEVE